MSLGIALLPAKISIVLNDLMYVYMHRYDHFHFSPVERRKAH